MNPYQKMAWFNLSVVLFTLVAFASLYTATGNLGGSQATFACLALFGFSGLFLAGGKGRAPLDDEYHRGIRLRSHAAAMLVFWFYFVGFSVYLTVHFETSIPKDLYSVFFWFGFMLLLAVQSLATLLIYGADRTERLTLVDRFRRMDSQRKGALLGLFISGFIGSVFFIAFLAMHKSDTPLSFQVLFMSIVYLALLSSILQIRHSMLKLAQGEREQVQASRAQRVSLIAMLIAGGATAAGLGLAALLPVNLHLTLHHALLGLFYVIWIGMLTPFLVLLMPQEKTSKAEDIQ